jgi:hypothetical protein
MVVGIILAAALGVAILAIVRLDLFGRREVPAQYQYRLDQVAEVDPNLILYRELSQRIETGFKQARTLVVDSNGLIYAAGDRQIRVFDQRGRPVKAIDVAAGPQCLALAEDGAVYVGTKDHVEVYDAAGQQAGVWPSLGPEAVLTAMALGKDEVFVADAGRRTVLRFDRQGKATGRIGDKDPNRGIEGFVVPSAHFDLTMAPDGLLRVVNPGRHRIEAYTTDGQMEVSWGRFGSDIEGFTGCCNPVTLAMLPDGGFVTAEKGVVRVKVYGPDGRFVGVVASPRQLIGSPGEVCQTVDQCQTSGFDVAADRQGRVYVLDTIQRQVRIFEKKP